MELDQRSGHCLESSNYIHVLAILFIFFKKKIVKEDIPWSFSQ